MGEIGGEESLNLFFQNCNTVSCKNPMIMMSMTRPCDIVPDNPPVTNPVQDAKVQSAESVECNDIPEPEIHSEPVGG